MGIAALVAMAVSGPDKPNGDEPQLDGNGKRIYDLGDWQTFVSKDERKTWEASQEPGGGGPSPLLILGIGGAVVVGGILLLKR